jgi:hypothetical protein
LDEIIAPNKFHRYKQELSENAAVFPENCRQENREVPGLEGSEGGKAGPD